MKNILNTTYNDQRKELFRMLDKGDQLLTLEEEEQLLTGFLHGYERRPYQDPGQLLSHKLTICIPLDGDWYRLGYLTGLTYRWNESRWLLN